MKKLVLLCISAFVLASTAALAESVTVDINAVSADGIGKKIGTVMAEDSAEGLVLKVDVSEVGAGNHGFHIHANPNCGNMAADGSKGAALAAGGHYDPANTGKHLGPERDGHKGDLPVLTADSNGVVKETVIAPHLKVADIKGRAFMIHAGGDNYSDEPAPLGGGGGRIACGVIP